jgi:hypothetical protein
MICKPLLSSIKKIYQRYDDGDLLLDDFYILSQLSCYYCGVEPKQKCNVFATRKRASSDYARMNGTFIYNGLDRVDCNLPHNKDNVVPCCKFCNYAKRQMTIEEFRLWVKQVHNYWASKI